MTKQTEIKLRKLIRESIKRQMNKKTTSNTKGSLIETKLKNLIRKEIKSNPKLLKEFAFAGGVVGMHAVNTFKGKYDEEYDENEVVETKLTKNQRIRTLLKKFGNSQKVLQAISEAMSDDDFDKVCETLIRK